MGLAWLIWKVFFEEVIVKLIDEWQEGASWQRLREEHFKQRYQLVKGCKARINHEWFINREKTHPHCGWIIVKRRRGRRRDVRERQEGADRVIFIGQDRKFGFFSDRKPLEGFKQKSDMIWLYRERIWWLLCSEWVKWKNGRKGTVRMPLY